MFDSQASQLDVKIRSTELFIGLVSPLGANLIGVVSNLTHELKKLRCTVVPIQLSGLLQVFNEFNSLPISPEEERLREFMKAGNDVRSRLQKPEALAMLAIAAIASKRQEITGDPQRPAERCVYILNSFKREEEIELFRKVYGSAFIALGAYAPKQSRVEMLAKRISESHNKHEISEYMGVAYDLIHTDEAERGEYGQAVRDAFPKVDSFVNVVDPIKLSHSIKRLVEIIFSYPYHTPTKDEDGMFHAQSAALRSSSMGRQVGAVIATQSGSVICVGSNEAPKYGGGLYWSDDDVDYRDFKLKEDSNDKIKQVILAEVIDRFRSNGILHVPEGVSSKDVASDCRRMLKDAAIMDLIEFYRPVHAEMAAIVEAAHRGVSVKDCTLYCTTFPCHECTRHIIAAGIKRVVYIEPYAKSRAEELHSNEIVVDRPSSDRAVSFEPFVGVAPRWYIKFFSMLDRKDRNGNIIQWETDTTKQVVREVFTEWLSYIDNEQTTIDSFTSLIRKAQLALGKEEEVK